MRFPLFLLFTALAVASPTGASPASADEGTAHRTQRGRRAFADMEDTLDAASMQRWHALRSALTADFRETCGDTFCEGVYADIEPVRLRCSVDTRTATLHGCLWTFAGVDASVDPTTGEITERARVFECPIDVTAPVADLLGAPTTTSSVAPLQRVVPGKETTFYDALVKCF